MPHLSFILKYLISPKYMRDNPDANLNTVHEGERGTSQIIGSSRDRLTMILYNKPDGYNGSFAIPMIVGIDDRVTVYDADERRITSMDFILDTTDCHTGYARLRPQDPHRWRNVVEAGTPWVKHLNLNVKATTTVYSDRMFSGFRYDGLPADVMEWVTRDREINWPPPTCIQAVLEIGCLLVSRAHAHSSSPDIEWQFVFHDAERFLASFLTDSQKYCFRVFKIVVDHYTNSLPMKLKTVHLKSVMFYTCEVIPNNSWSKNCGGCVIYLLERLILHVSAGKLPNYFICGNNMVDHFSENDLENNVRRLRDIRTFPVPSIVFLAEAHDIHQSFMVDPVMQDIAAFKQDKDIERTTRQAFIPAIILLAKAYLHSEADSRVGELFQTAFETFKSLPASMKSESEVTFRAFVLDVIGKETDASAYSIADVLDKQLKLDLLPALQPIGNVTMLRDIIDAKDAGIYANDLIERSVLHCTLSQMKIIDHFALFYFMSGQLKESANLLQVALAKADAARSEVIDPEEIEEPGLKEEIIRQNDRKRRNVESTLSVIHSHLRTCMGAGEV